MFDLRYHLTKNGHVINGNEVFLESAYFTDDSD